MDYLHIRKTTLFCLNFLTRRPSFGDGFMPPGSSSQVSARAATTTCVYGVLMMLRSRHVMSPDVWFNTDKQIILSPSPWRYGWLHLCSCGKMWWSDTHVGQILYTCNVQFVWPVLLD